MHDPFLPADPAPRALPGDEYDAYFAGLAHAVAEPDAHARNDERVCPRGVDPEYDLRAVVASEHSFTGVEFARGEAPQHRALAVRALWEAYGPCRVTVETPDAIPHMHCGVCGRLLPVVVRRETWRLDLPPHTPEPLGGTTLCANTTWAVSGLRDRLSTPMHRAHAPWVRAHPGWLDALAAVRGASTELAQLLVNTGTQAWAEARRAQTRTPARAAYPQAPGLPQYRPLHTVFTPAGTPWAVDHALVWDVLQDADREGYAGAFSGPHMGLARALHAGVIRTTGGASSPTAGLSERPTVTAYHLDVVTLLRLALGAVLTWRGTYVREVAAWPGTTAPELYLTRHGREALRCALSGLLRAVVASRTPEATAARFEALRGALALAGDAGDSPPVEAGPETARAVSAEAYRAVLPLLAGWYAEAAGSTPAPAPGAIRTASR